MEWEVKENDNEQFIKRGTLAVLGVLRDLQRFRAPIMVTHARGQLISRILHVDDQQLIFDLGSNDYDNQVVQDVAEIHFSGDMQGARIEFSLTAFTVGEWENMPAFIAPLPEQLLKIQRREYFRISAPLEPVFWCHTRWPDGKPARFRLQDLSLGGMGVLLDEPLPDGLNGGEIMKNMRVELGEYGQFELDAQLLHVGERSTVSKKNETRVTPRLSFRFDSLNPVQERQLQQVIFALERLARDKATRFQ
ncbi:Flagellar brake protein YcgR [Duffyella gerundensis]|uniref:Flagellar brake protein YcgR n=1 Tax=Duffyella gerundensis TaxID=1619313 RepID=A0A0U5L4Q8_9GAMM|nr:flagellar brake protein [Duffyella gerundensis]CUU23750.1 Flagellar brake protein YcgR [Duffyella gerundensis]